MEIWKDIAGYEGLYQVSNLGNVKSFCKKTPHILSPATDRNGYSSVCLHIDGKKRTCTIHRLVAKAFIPNPDNKRDVNHLNGVKTDNRVENLEWCTPSENNRHAFDAGLKAQGEEHFNAKLTNEQVRYIRENPDGLTGAELADKFNVTPTAISFIQLGKRYRIVGGNIRESKKHISRVPDDIRNEIRKLYVYGSKEFGTHTLSRKYNLSRQTISNIVRDI